jgi:hypothetical protein
VWSVSTLGVGGSTYDGVRSAATLDVATTHPASTRPRMRTRQVTLSSAASSQARIGFGTTEQTHTWKGLASHPRSIIPSTNPCLDQPEGSPPTGRTSWWNRDDAMGRDRLEGPEVLRMQIVEFGPPGPILYSPLLFRLLQGHGATSPAPADRLLALAWRD